MPKSLQAAVSNSSMITIPREVMKLAKHRSLYSHLHSRQPRYEGRITGEHSRPSKYSYPCYTVLVANDSQSCESTYKPNNCWEDYPHLLITKYALKATSYYLIHATNVHRGTSTGMSTSQFPTRHREINRTMQPTLPSQLCTRTAHIFRFPAFPA